MNVVKFSIIHGILIWGIIYNRTYLVLLMIFFALCFAINFVFQAIFRTKLARKILIVSNDEPNEPRSFFDVMVDHDPVENFVKNFNKDLPDDKKISTNLVAILAFGRAVKKANLDGKLVYDNFIKCDNVGIMMPVNVDGKNLVAAVARNCESETFEGLRDKLKKKLHALKSDKDKEMNKQLKLLSSLPSFVIDIFFNISAYISYNMNLSIPQLSVTKDHFGCAIVSNISGFTMYDCHGPFIHYTRNTIGSVICPNRKVPVVKDGKIVIEKRAKIGMLSDVRVVSPVEEDLFSKELKRLWANPELIARA